MTIHREAGTVGRFLKAFAVAAGTGGIVGYAEGQRNWKDRDVIIDAAKSMRQKAAIGAIGQSNGASALTDTVVGEVFLDMIRPYSLIASMLAARFVPLNTRVLAFVSGTTGYMIDEGHALPVSGIAASTAVVLQPRKAGALSIVTQEVLRNVSPKAEATLANDLAAGVARAQDYAFVSPAVPGSVLHDAPTVASSGSSVAAIDADLKAAILATNSGGPYLVWVMSPLTAISLSLKRGANDELAYPGLSVLGGWLAGLPVFVSAAVNGYVGLIDQAGLVLGDLEDVEIQRSTQGSFEMQTSPTSNSIAPTASNVVNMYQTDSVALMAVLYGGWYMRPGLAAVITGVAF